MKKILFILAAIAFLSATATADWFPGDGFKMHFPQMPNEEGYNVNATYPLFLGDDWQCTETGPVSDIHFWGSWLGGTPGEIISFNVSIYSDFPDPDGPEGPLYSHPELLLWQHEFMAGEVMMRQIIPDPQLWEGWYDPPTGFNAYPDHDNYWQYNIFNIPEPFIQNAGEIYWLVISANVFDPEMTKWGWKSSINHFNDDAVWGEQPFVDWYELREPPMFEVSMDLAFVITTTPEAIPTLNEWGMIILALLLLAAGTIAIIRRRKLAAAGEK
ncbi:MAG: IPTL-CTERM sorting domain-containing protein [candidate division Zixibacteria bacterium]|nr:IPTL-CTERM sorting domain-containing protein [candidate division Zixibacteria bacterium]